MLVVGGFHIAAQLVSRCPEVGFEPEMRAVAVRLLHPVHDGRSLLHRRPPSIAIADHKPR